MQVKSIGSSNRLQVFCKIYVTKETSAQVFFCEFLTNTFFRERLRSPASVLVFCAPHLSIFILILANQEMSVCFALDFSLKYPTSNFPTLPRWISTSLNLDKKRKKIPRNAFHICVVITYCATTRKGFLSLKLF